jgi:hypothetical protein
MSRSGFRGRPGQTCAAGVLAGGALVLGALPAAAQLSAETLWRDWQSAYTGFGGTLTAEEETYADGVLTLGGVTVASNVEGAESTTMLGDLTLREQDDGTVSVELPAVIEMTTTSTVQGPDGEETIEVDVELTQNDFDMVVSEEADARRYAYTATSVIANVETPGNSEGGSGTVTVAARGLEGITTLSAGRFEQAQSAESMTFQSFASDAEGGEGGGEGGGEASAGGTTIRYQMTDMTGEASGTMPEPREAGGDAGAITLAEMGLDATGALRHSGSLIEIDVDGPQPLTAQGGSETGGIEFSVDPRSVTYALVSENTSMEVTADALPVAVPFDLASSRAEFQLPVGGEEAPSPFGAMLALRELSLGEAVWGTFDPSGQLPREPVTVVLDLDGTARMNADLFGDPTALAELQGPPGVPETLDLTEMLVRFGGAELRGEGSVTFDQAMSPVGTVDLALDGGMSLLDRLVALGVLPQEQVMGLRAMLGVVARPVGEDNLTSTIEFTADGGIIANGMQIR